LRLHEQSSQQAFAATQTQLDALQQQAGLGLLSKLDLGNAQVKKLYAQQQRDRASAERNIAYVALYKALGGAPLPATTLKDTD